ncbi:HEAT repeat domain-containing protein [Microcoleus sp. LAD1_D3]
MLEDSDADVRRDAALALGSIGAETETVVPQLIPLLEDSDSGVRSDAAFALGDIGAEAKTALSQLVPLLKDSDSGVRDAVAKAFEKIGLSLQKKAHWLTSLELDIAVSNLESALKIVAEPEANFSQSTIANLRIYINALKAAQSNRPFIQSIPTNPYIWGIYLFFLFGTSATPRRWWRKIYETLKPK